MSPIVVILLAVAAGGVAAAIIVGVWSASQKRKLALHLEELETERVRILEEGRRDAEAKLRDAELQAKERLLAARSEFEKSSSARRQELGELEKRLLSKEENLDKKQSTLDRKDADLQKLDRSITDREKGLAKKEAESEELVASQRRKLEQIAGLTVEEAKKELVRNIENEVRLGATATCRRIEEEAIEGANQKARRIISTAIQRVASDHVVENTVSVVDLPSDDMKGRIIGREGRNIRALEAATGVDLIVDDTPEAIILSSFDPIRREIARITIGRLMSDGRIHPARIEETVEKTRAEFWEQIKSEGEAAAFELGVPDLHPELIKLLGRLRYRTSYGQNVLQHSKEVAWCSSVMAAEIGVDATVARRAGLLHDVGKAIDREMDGTHLELGREVLRKFGERPDVIHAMECHHGDYEPKSIEAVLVNAADALSAARPGARREIMETYIKRLEKLEKIPEGMDGVQKIFAMQAGRELRIIVDSGKVSDEKAYWISKDVARRIEAELTYPGQIRVTVLRETRAVEYAK
jgi:ribonuclease Y